MNYDYSFTNEEYKILYYELKKIIDSDEYKLLRREYNKYINKIAKNIYELKIKNPFSIAYLLRKEINCNFENKRKEKIDLDVLYKLWGSRVCTNDFSNRHIVSFINDILIKSGYFSCKILACKENLNFSFINSNNIISNYILLCIIFNGKKIFYDIEDNELLNISRLLSSSKYNCYIPYLNNEKSLYFVNNGDNNNFEINSDHLFVLNNFTSLGECKKKDYGNKEFIKDYLSFLDEYDSNLLCIDDSNIDTIAALNDIISIKQDDIYKKVKKYDR